MVGHDRLVGFAGKGADDYFGKLGSPSLKSLVRLFVHKSVPLINLHMHNCMSRRSCIPMRVYIRQERLDKHEY